jgi:UPF0716 protein FxsA
VLGWLILLFVLTPILEIWLLLQLSEAVGVAPTVALVLVTGVLGGIVARWQGTEALDEILAAASSGKAPGRELGAGALFVAGAAFLLTPGIVTDVAGFLLMVPPVRRQAAELLVERLKESASVQVEVRTGGPGGPDLGGGPAGKPKRVDADARVVGDEDEDDDPRPPERP